MAEEKQFREGVRLNYNIATQQKYEKIVNNTLMDPLMNETEERVNNIFEDFAIAVITYSTLNNRVRSTLKDIEKKYGIIFKLQAERIAKDYLNDIQKQSKSGVLANIKVLSLGRTTAYKENKDNMNAICKNSDAALVLLIMSMFRFYIEKVEKQVYQLALSGSTTAEEAQKGIDPDEPPPTPPAKPKKEKPKKVFPEQEKTVLEEYLEKQREITHRKTRNDLNQGYRRIFNALNKERLESNNIEQWEWVHTNRAKTQNPFHMNHLNGLVFNYDSPPPVIDVASGTTGYPGDWYGCMCIMLPVSPLL